MTAAGRCHWVEADLCSACVARAERQPVLTALDIEALQRVEFAVQFTGPVALQILAALHLALRHPEFPEYTMGTVLDFCSCLSGEIGVTENLAFLCAAGLDPKQDVPIERPRIILP